MRSKAHRLRSEADIKQVLETGTKTKIGPLLIFHLPNQEKGRFGLVISKKVDKRATRRNYLRRLLDGLITELVNSQLPTGDLVIMVLYSPQEAAKEFRRSLTIWAEKLPLVS